MQRTRKMIGALAGLVMAAAFQSALAQGNCCYNNDFTSGKGPLDGWNVDYDWTRNKHQMGNQKNASVLPEFKGRKNVLKMAVPCGFETKVETPLIPYETGDRYQCTFDVYVEKTVVVNVLFQGYNLKPGVPPNDDVKLPDLRRMYKGEYVVAKGPMWKTMSVVIPHPKISATAYNHLKKIRYLTVLMYVPGATYFADGNFYVSNLRIVKLPGKATVTQ